MHQIGSKTIGGGKYYYYYSSYGGRLSQRLTTTTTTKSIRTVSSRRQRRLLCGVASTSSSFQIATTGPIWSWRDAPSSFASSLQYRMTTTTTTNTITTDPYYHIPQRISSKSSRPPVVMSTLTTTTTGTTTTTTTPHPNDSNTTAAAAEVVVVLDIEALHEQACARGERTYLDPATGLTCFTRLAHLTRGICCGNHCRHCPYSWENVKAVQAAAMVKGDDGDDDDSSSSSSCSSDASHHSTPRAVPPRTRTGGRHGGTETKKNVVYTRGGDAGTSQLLTGERRIKSDPVFDALGTVDELCSVVGVAHAELIVVSSRNHHHPDDPPTTTDESRRKELELLQEWLLEIMSRLFDIGSHVAKPRPVGHDFIPDGVGNGFDAIHVQELELWIDRMTEALPELTSFVLPTGSRVGAQLHVARTVCRRTERSIVPLMPGCDPNALAYINRLSDFFFTAARYVNDRLGVPDIAYQRPTRSAQQRTRVVLKSNDGPD